MRRAVLLCLFSAAFAAADAQSPPTWKEPREPMQEVLLNHPPKFPDQQQQQQQGGTANKLTCGRTTMPTGYQPLPAVPRTDGYLEFSGTLATWAPIGNDTECHIRQLYFFIPDTIVEGPSGAVVGPDFLVTLYKAGSDTPVKVPISFDTVSFIAGYLYYRIDAQLQEPAHPKKILKGDYVMKISVVGKPKP